MGDTVWFGEGGSLAAAIDAEPAMPGASALARAGLVLVPIALFGELLGFSPVSIPIVVIGAPDDGRARARLFDAGAADVVPASIDPAELAARLRAIRRRSETGLTVCGDLAIDLVTRRASLVGRALALHPRSFAVLACLARQVGRPVSRAMLYEAVWQRRFDPGTNVVAVTVSRLRAHLGRPLVHTVPGGYRLGDPVAEE